MDIIERFLKKFRKQNPESSSQVERELRPLGGEEDFLQPRTGPFKERQEQRKLERKKRREVQVTE